MMVSDTNFALPVRRSLLVVSLFLLFVACSSSATPKVEEFPAYLLGTWTEVNGPIGTLKFEGSESSGIAIRSADGINAESFLFQWVAPALIRTNLSGDSEFTVLFEDGGDTLVLATVASAESNAIIRYSRVK